MADVSEKYVKFTDIENMTDNGEAPAEAPQGDGDTVVNWQIKSGVYAIIALVLLNVCLGPYYFIRIMNDFALDELRKNPLNIDSVDYATTNSMKARVNSAKDFFRALDPKYYNDKFAFMLFLITSFCILLISIGLAAYIHSRKDTTLQPILYFALGMIVYAIISFSMNLSVYIDTSKAVTDVVADYEHFNAYCKSRVLCNEGGFLRNLTTAPNNTFHQSKIIQDGFEILKPTPNNQYPKDEIPSTAICTSVESCKPTDSSDSSTSNSSGSSGSSNSSGTSQSTQSTTIATTSADYLAKVYFTINMYVHYCKIGAYDKQSRDDALQLFCPLKYVNANAEVKFTDYLFRKTTRIHNYCKDTYINRTYKDLAFFKQYEDKPEVMTQAENLCEKWINDLNDMTVSFYPKMAYEKIRNMTVAIAVVQAAPVAIAIGLYFKFDYVQEAVQNFIDFIIKV